MNVLVTGATGFIGGGIARDAAARGWKVSALHRGDHPSVDGVAWRTFEELEGGTERYDVVIHAAAIRHRHGVPNEEYARVNSELTARVCALARARAGRLVLVSSIAVYGWPDRLPVDESFPYAPVGDYGRSKIHCEEAVRAVGIPWTIVQPSITYGPGDTNGMMDKILRMIARRRFIGPGLGQSRVQLVYIDDVARLTNDAAVSERTVGEAFICTYREPIRMRELIRLSRRAVGVWLPSVGPPVPLLKVAALGFEALEKAGVIRGEPPLTREKLATVSVDRAFRIDKLRRLLGDEPRVGYAEGFERTARALGLAQ